METSSDAQLGRIEEFMSDTPCPKCHGARLKESSLAVKVGGLNIFELTELSISNAVKFLKI